MSQRCPRCGTSAAPTGNYCPSCGESLSDRGAAVGTTPGETASGQAQPLARRASVTRGLLYAHIGASGVIVLLSLAVLGSLGSAGGVSQTNLDLISLIGVVQVPLLIVTAVAWLMWQHRAQSNIHAAGVGGLTFSPGWAVGYWFIPIINLYRPYQSVRELWSASEPGAPRSAQWLKTPGAARIGWWWLAYLSSNIIGSVVANFEVTTIDEARAWLLVNVAAETLTVAAAWLAITIVRGVEERQSQRFGLLSGA